MLAKNFPSFSMKTTSALVLGICIAFKCAAAVSTPPEVVVQHLSTVFAGQGMCAVRFSMETVMGDGDAGSVTLNLTFRNKNNKVVARGELSADLTDTPGGRYEEPILEGQEYCLGSDTRVFVTRARSEHRGKKYDLLKLKKIRISDFKPYPISLSATK